MLDILLVEQKQTHDFGDGEGEVDAYQIGPYWISASDPDLFFIRSHNGYDFLHYATNAENAYLNIINNFSIVDGGESLGSSYVHTLLELVEEYHTLAVGAGADVSGLAKARNAVRQIVDVEWWDETTESWVRGRYAEWQAAGKPQRRRVAGAHVIVSVSHGATW